MDFFEHQDRARRKTGQLIFLFSLGLLGTLAAVNVLTFAGYWLMFDPATAAPVPQQPTIEIPALLQGWFEPSTGSSRHGFLFVWQQWWGSNLNWQVSMGVLAAVAIGTAFRYFELAGGGRSVARWAGATEVDMNTTDSAVRQLINTSEEMAIAAGMAVPELFVMERESAINAFVAGYNPDEAVLVVTRGALDTLTRDQLQGVIGHEYSHILNGDMRINVRLMSFLAGLVMIGQIGRFLLENSFRSRRIRSSKSDSKAVTLFFAFGVMLVVVGYIGVLVGRMIKAAVSRQREYLADASSVQFTRNPDGLAGALYAINQHVEGSSLQHQHAEDMSHFCFGESVALSDKLATHPPITERIRRISPNFIAVTRSKQRQSETVEASVARSQPQAFETAMLAAGVTALVGNTTPDHVSYARNLYQHIPEQLKNAVHTSDGARAFLYSQVLLGSEGDQQKILDVIKREDPGVMTQLQKIWQFSQKMDAQLRQPVLELALPTLKRLPEADRLIFIDRLERLVRLDQRVDLIEWATITLTKLRLQTQKRPHRNRLKGRIEPYLQSVDVLLQVFVGLSPDRSRAEPAYQQVCKQLGIEAGLSGRSSMPSFDELDQALVALDHISFTWRKVILQASADIVESDGRIAFAEYEALRLVAECLDCPMPPLMLALQEADERDQAISYQ